MTALDALFAPRTLAILGVSRDPTKLGHRLLQNVVEGGYAGRVYPVNPSGAPILGRPSVPRIEDLPSGIDLALVSVPAGAVPEAIVGLAGRGVRTAVVLSSGFGEVDDDGRSVQHSMREAAQRAGLRLVGPNCMGVFSAPARLNATYFWDLPRLDGGIAVVSQSGAYGGLIFRHLGGRGLGVARFLSIGNQVDIDLAEVLEYLAADDATTLVACFVEALVDGARFVRAARELTRRKPVVVLKGGRSDAGRRAAGSHTGSLAGRYEVYRAVFRRAGVVVAEETEEFFDAIETLAVVGERRAAAPRVAIVTVSGGPSVVAADTAERSGIAVPALGDETRATLRRVLPPFAAVGNPVDLTPQVEASRIGAAVRAVFDAPEVAGVVAVNVGLDIPEFAEGVADAVAETGKPAVAFVADAPRIAARLGARHVPVLASPERAVRAWRALLSARRPPAREVLRTVTVPLDLERAVETTTGPLPYAVARRLLEAAGVRFCRERSAATLDEAVAAADEVGYPVVVKADTAGLTHKTEAGAVRVGLENAGEVRAACVDFVERLGPVGFVVQALVGPGVELLIGARRDPIGGPVVVLGTGGVLTEVIGDVSVRLAPLTDEEALEMLGEGLRPRLLAGPRGTPRVAGDAVVETLHAVAGLIVANPQIREIDLNPVIAAGADLVAVDALVIVG